MRKNKWLFAVTFAVLGIALVSTVNEQDELTPLLSVSPDNSNIVSVIGSGFDSSENVTLELIANETTFDTFTESVTTDEEANFSTVVIVPTSLSGNYNLTASTSNASAYVEYTVPDLTGPQGETGEIGYHRSNRLNGNHRSSRCLCRLNNSVCGNRIRLTCNSTCIGCCDQKTLVLARLKGHKDSPSYVNYQPPFLITTKTSETLPSLLKIWDLIIAQ